jgi:hypothetical protein
MSSSSALKRSTMIERRWLTSVNLRELTSEDLWGHLLTAEEGYDLDDATDGVSKLLMTEE